MARNCEEECVPFPQRSDHGLEGAVVSEQGEAVSREGGLDELRQPEVFLALGIQVCALRQRRALVTQASRAESPGSLAEHPD